MTRGVVCTPRQYTSPQKNFSIQHILDLMVLAELYDERCGISTPRLVLALKIHAKPKENLKKGEIYIFGAI